MALLSVSNAELYYDHVYALKGVSIEVHEGETVALIGANGAGKSSILRAITGLRKLRSGEIHYDGRRLDGIAQTLEGVLARFPRLKERYSQQASTLSGGEQQMMVIGRALMAKPRLLLLDEPSLGVAPKLVQDIARSIVAINKEEGVSVLLVEQNSRMALRISSRAYALTTGTVALSGNSNELLNDERVKALYLGGEV